jgi:hypothetical protein
MPQAAEAAMLVASELVTNVVRKAIGPDGRAVLLDGGQPPEFWFSMFSDRAQLLLRVWDPFPEAPAPKVALFDDESGRGLTIVGALTNGQWGYEPVQKNPPGGKIVWALLRAGP